VVVTASEASTTPTAKPKKTSSEPNKAAIAAGVVVGVVGLAAIIAGVVFFLKQKRRREIEEEYRRQAAVNSFVGAGKLHTSNSSMNDSRLDPEVMLRRQSDGSIADNEDYSRRILKVCFHSQGLLPRSI
jgi:cell wall integrity and stress response component